MRNKLARHRATIAREISEAEKIGCAEEDRW
jgi:hypothetical protein